MSTYKQTHESVHKERLIEAKSVLKTELYQRLDDLKADYEQRTEQSKLKLDAKYSNKEAGIIQETADDGTYSKQVEIYKRSKEAEVKKSKQMIDDEYQDKLIQDQKKDA